MINQNLHKVKQELGPNVQLIAVSKKRSLDEIMTLYDTGQRHFGENRVQELMDKKNDLPADIHWHLIGHLQRNKVKYIADFIYMIHSVDSIKLASAINKQAEKHKRTIPILAQLHIAMEESKFGIPPEKFDAFINEFNALDLSNVKLEGLMTMASLTDNKDQIITEFTAAKNLFDQHKKAQTTFKYLSMGMSGDYPLAVQCGANMVRVGSKLFV